MQAGVPSRTVAEYQSPDGQILVQLNKQGELRHQKVSYPPLVGNYHQVITPDHCFYYDLNGDIKYIRGRKRDWPHPSEWLKRTRCNRWVYYFSGRYTEDLKDCLGEYYLPCLQTPSNSLWKVGPFAWEPVRWALSTWQEVPAMLEAMTERDAPSWLAEFALRLRERDETWLQDRAMKLIHVLGDEIRVLPPDTRHVDYEVLPLLVQRGCLYRCSFCRVKSGNFFRTRSEAELEQQWQGVLNVVDRDLINCNAAFLGQEDALQAGEDLIVFAARRVLQSLEPSPLQGRYLFLFASVHSLLSASEDLWRSLRKLPCKTYINVGLESAHQGTLDYLGKPEKAERVREAFSRMLQINRDWEKVEISVNFISDPHLPSGHWDEMRDLLSRLPSGLQNKGAVYLSPMGDCSKREHMRFFQPLKRKSRLPLYFYLIQPL